MDVDPRAISTETAALVALVKGGADRQTTVADRVEEAGSAQGILEEQHGLLASVQVDSAITDITRWAQDGIRVVTLLDADYPENLRAVYDRPVLIFIRGRLEACDSRSVAVIGSRQASPAGIGRARAAAEELVDAGYTVVSGLAAGIDAAAHNAALDRGARTVAVIGTGLEHAYPPQNAVLQQTIAEKGAVVSQFLPAAGPERPHFPLRNAVMSGLTVASLVVEASPTSGARTQVRSALAHGRPVLLVGALLDQQWARDLAGRPGVHVVRSRSELSEVLARLSATDALVA